MERPLNAPDPDHPLLIASRYNDADAQEHGLDGTVTKQGLKLSDLRYVAQQRAMRLVMLFSGRQDELAEFSARNEPTDIKFTADEMQKIGELTDLYLDGIMIGWRARGVLDT